MFSNIFITFAPTLKSLGTSFNCPWGQVVQDKKFEGDNGCCWKSLTEELVKVSEEVLCRPAAAIRFNFVRLEGSVVEVEVEGSVVVEVVLRRVGKGHEVVSSKNLKTKMKAFYTTGLYYKALKCRDINIDMWYDRI